MDTDLSLTSTPTNITLGKPKSKAWMWILLIIFVLLIVAGVLVYFFVFDKSTGGTTPAGTKASWTPPPNITEPAIAYDWKYSPWPTPVPCPTSGEVTRDQLGCYEYQNGKETGKVDDSKCNKEAQSPSDFTRTCINPESTCTLSNGADYPCTRCNNSKYNEKTDGPACAPGYTCSSTKQTCIRTCSADPKGTSSYICNTCGKDNECATGFVCSAETNKQTTGGDHYCYKKDIDTDTYVIEDKICWPGMGKWRMSATAPTLDNKGDLKGLWDCKCNSDNYDPQTGCSPILQHTLRLRDNLFNEENIPGFNADNLQATVVDSETKELTSTAKLMNQYFISENSNAGSTANSQSEPVTMPCSNSQDWSKVVSSIKSNPDMLTTSNGGLNFGTLVDTNKVTVDNLEKQWCLLDSATKTDATTKETYNPLLQHSSTNICSNCRYDNSGGSCNKITCSNTDTCTDIGWCDCPLGKSYTTTDSNTGFSSWNCAQGTGVTCDKGGQLILADNLIPTGDCDCRPRSTEGALVTKEPESNLGYAGPQCSINVNQHCNGSPGDFTDSKYHNETADNIKCTCASGTAGDTCQYSNANDCSGNGIVNDNGECLKSDGTSSCVEHWQGSDCSSCPQDVENGFFVETETGQHCNTCKAGYTPDSCKGCAANHWGAECEMCTMTCQNGGTCGGSNTTTDICHCDYPWTGPKCQYSNSTTCNKQGNYSGTGAVDGVGPKGECGSCKGHYTGTYCDDCSSNHCGSKCDDTGCESDTTSWSNFSPSHTCDGGDDKCCWQSQGIDELGQTNCPWGTHDTERAHRPAGTGLAEFAEYYKQCSPCG